MPAAALYNLSGEKDFTKETFKAVGDLKAVEIFSGRVLVAIYIQPRTTKGGIVLPDSAVKENVWQGQVGLVLKKGNMAFQDDTTHEFHGQDVAVGDWVVFRPGDTKRVQINGVDCRLIEDALIDMKIADPSIVTHQQ